MRTFTVREAAALLGVQPRRIQDMIARGDIPDVTRHGERVYVIPESSLERAIRRPVGRPRKIVREVSQTP